MNFEINLPFAVIKVQNATKRHKHFFDELLFTLPKNTPHLITLNLQFKKITVEGERTFVEKDAVFSNNHFFINDTKFYKAQIDFHTFTEDTVSIYADPEFDLYLLFTFILEPLLIIWGAHHAVVFLHASGIAHKKQVSLFTAWRNTGKKNAIIQLCKFGNTFYGDDFCVVKDSYVYVYPKSLNLFSYNLRAFPALFRSLPLGLALRLKITMALKSLLFTCSQVTSGAISKILYRVSELAEISTNIKIHPPLLGIIVGSKDKLKTTFLIQKSSTKQTKIVQTSLPVIIEKIYGIVAFELKDFFEIYTKYLYLSSHRENKVIRDFELNYIKSIKKNIQTAELINLGMEKNLESILTQ
jgi:hypothetical protein